MLEIVLMLIAAHCALNYAGIMCTWLEERRGRREGMQRERERERERQKKKKEGEEAGGRNRGRKREGR